MKPRSRRSFLKASAVLGCGLGTFAVLASIALTGCGTGNNAADGATAATPVSSSGNQTADAAVLPAEDEILRQIDEALEYTYDHRRLSVGSTANDQAAWQIVHGALAFKREFLVSDGMRDVT